MRANKTGKPVATALGIVLLIGIFLLLRFLKGPLVVFPDLKDILQAFSRILSEGKTYLLIGTTFLNVLISLAAALMIGGVLGFLEGMSVFFRAMMKPLMALLRTLPMIMLIILVMILLPTRRYLFVPAVSVSLILIPIISEAVCEGYLSIDPEYLDVYRMNSRLNLKVLRSVHLPLISGFLRQAFINAAGTGFKIAITAEYLVQASHTLGKEIYMSSYFNEYEEIYAYALLVVLLVLVITWIPAAVRWTGALKNRKSSLKRIA